MAAVPAAADDVAPPTLLSVSGRTPSSQDCRCAAGVTLFGVQGLKNTTVSEGELVILEWQVCAHPSPVIMWFREDYKIESSTDFQMSYEDGRAQLLIREAFAEDSGRFTCTATNQAGSVSTSCYLLVQGEEHQGQARPPAGCLLTGSSSLPVSEDVSEESREEPAAPTQDVEAAEEL